MMTDLPNPLVPHDIDLRDFSFMPLDVVRLRDSELSASVSGEEFRAAVLLWCASWHQIPAGSLPDDDAQLSQLAGFGRVVKEWKKYKKGAMHHWVKCSDGRLYHPTVCEKALESWAGKLRQRYTTECARIRKSNERHKTTSPVPTYEEWASANSHVRQATSVVCDMDGMSRKSPANIDSKGQGEGQGEGHNIAAAQPCAAPPEKIEFQKPGAESQSSQLRIAEANCRNALGDCAPLDLVIGPMMPVIAEFGSDRVSEILRSEAMRPRRAPIRTWKIWAEIVRERAPDYSAGPPRASPGFVPANAKYDAKAAIEESIKIRAARAQGPAA